MADKKFKEEDTDLPVCYQRDADEQKGIVKTVLEFSRDNPDFYECEYDNILRLGKVAYETQGNNKPIEEDNDTDDDYEALQIWKMKR